MIPYFGRLVPGPKLLTFDERDFIEGICGGGSECTTIECETKCWHEEQKQSDEELEENFGDDAEAIKGMWWGMEDVLANLAWCAKGIRVGETSTWREERPSINIDLAPMGFGWSYIECNAAPDQPTPANIAAVVAQIGSKGAVARRMGVNVRKIRRWCSSTPPEPGRAGITDGEWRRLQALVPQLESEQPVSKLSSRYSDEERNAIEDALNSGRVRRIEQGAW